MLTSVKDPVFTIYAQQPKFDSERVDINSNTKAPRTRL